MGGQRNIAEFAQHRSVVIVTVQHNKHVIFRITVAPESYAIERKINIAIQLIRGNIPSELIKNDLRELCVCVCVRENVYAKQRSCKCFI